VRANFRSKPDQKNEKKPLNPFKTKARRCTGSQCQPAPSGLSVPAAQLGDQSPQVSAADIFNTDQGNRSTSLEFTQLLKAHSKRQHTYEDT